MDMSMGDMGDMSGMDMGDGMPSYPQMQQYYWAVVGTAVGIATLFNVLNWLNYRQRISAANKGLSTPAKPKSWFWKCCATLTAIQREATYASLPPLRIRGFTIPLPRAGPTILVLGNVIVLLVLCFYKLDTNDYSTYEDIGYRTGFINICQLPLLFLLAGKNNIIGTLTGFSHEKLNWLHRWVARCLLLTVTIHMGYWFADWAPYDYISVKIATDDITKHGMIAWAILLWIVFSSMTPIRGWCYEFFVVQHIISFAAFLAIVWLHVPATSTGPRYWVYICIGLAALDRLIRWVRTLWINLAIFHPRQLKNADKPSLLSCQAELIPLTHDTTKITIKNPPISWRPGQYVYLSCHSIVPLQSHPFTIASLPEDGKMEFLIKSKKGATQRFFRHTSKKGILPTTTADIKATLGKVSAIEGPYGNTRPLRQFDSVLFFAGSTGATFTMPLMRDLVASWRRKESKRPGSLLNSPEGTVTRNIRFVWIVKSRGQLEWFSSQLTKVIQDVERLREEGADVMIDISIYVTCDPIFTEEHQEAVKSHSHVDSPKHGVVEEIASDDEKADEKLGEKVEQREVKEVGSETSSATERQETKGGCGPNGTCCCRATVEDEDAITSAICCCNTSKSQPSSTTQGSTAVSRSSSESKIAQKKPLLVHPTISVLGGRPQPRNIMRKTLEQAYGESAVVVCGPKGLIDDVRMSTVSLSDERAVHKGTGAQGICLITESFGF
ncbi:MAG: hypothetical protein M1820_002447 [Bogoriella megaspora]|nr:MAG: hypothetical protein M1820_002447 [Bogoriella megaspora]